MILSAKSQITHGERVKRVAQALDSIRYEDEGIVKYSLSDISKKANEKEKDISEVFRALEEDFGVWKESRSEYEENKRQLEQIKSQYDALDTKNDEFESVLEELDDFVENEETRLDAEEDFVADIEEKFLKQEGLWDDYLDIKDMFSDIKYDGETESGPGAFITVVNGPKEAMEHHANEMPNTNWKNENDENMPAGYEPDIFDEGFPQAIYETMESNDGAIIFGNNGFSSSMYEIPDVENLDEDLMPKKGGTKHRAAVKAAHSNLREKYGEEFEVTSIVLSETDGYIRVFGENGATEIPYNPETEERIGDLEFQESNSSEVIPDGGQPIEY